VASRGVAAVIVELAGGGGAEASSLAWPAASLSLPSGGISVVSCARASTGSAKHNATKPRIVAPRRLEETACRISRHFFSLLKSTLRSIECARKPHVRLYLDDFAGQKVNAGPKKKSKTRSKLQTILTSPQHGWHVASYLLTSSRTFLGRRLHSNPT
jgi:hypothetical protein